MMALDPMTETPPTPDAEQLLAHGAWVRRLARELVGDTLADDVVQETWLAAWRAGPRNEEHLRPWLGRVVRNFARAARRSEKARNARERASARVDEAWPSPTDILETLEIQRELVDALRGLDEPLRRTLVLRYVEARTAVEIAELDGVPESTVRGRVQRGLARLREVLDARHGGDRSAWCAILIPLATRTGRRLLPLGPILAMHTSLKIGLALLVLAVCCLWFYLSRSSEPGPRALLASGTTPSLEVSPPEVGGEVHLGGAELQRELATTLKAPPATLPVRLRAQLVDAQRAPLAGARLQVARGPAPWSAQESAPSGADGRVELVLPSAPLPARSWIELVATSPARVPCHTGLRVSAGDSVELGELELPFAATLTGRIFDASGAPAAGAEVYVRPNDGEQHGFPRLLERKLEQGQPSGLGHVLATSVDLDIARTKTRRDGSYHVDGVAAGFAMVCAWRPHSSIATSAPFEIRAGELCAAPDVTLGAPDSARAIQGRVVGPDGAPFRGAHVYGDLMYASHPDMHAVTDDAGEFTLVPLTRQTSCMLVADDPARLFGLLTLKDVPLGTRDIELQLKELRTVRVEARFPDGTLAPHVDIGLTYRGVPFESNAVARDPDGAPLLRLPDVEFRVDVRGASFETVTAGPWKPEAVPATIQVEVISSPKVEGRVLLAGKPVLGADVRILRAVEEGAIATVPGVRARGGPLFARVYSPSSEISVRTDSEGRFALRLAAERTNVLRVEADGAAPRIIWSAIPTDDLLIELDSGGAISGEVLADDGASRAGRVVGATCGDGAVVYARTDETGRYHLDRLSPGDWQVRLIDAEQRPSDGGRSLSRSPGTASAILQDVHVVLGETVTFDLDGRSSTVARLRGRLRIDGAAPKGWVAHLVAAKGAPRPTSVVAPDGSFEFAAPRSGSNGVTLAGRCAEGNELNVYTKLELVPGANDWSLDLATAVVSSRAALMVRDGRVVTHVDVRMVDQLGTRISTRLLCDADRRILPSRVPAGRVELTLHAKRTSPFDEPETRTIDLRPGAAIELDAP